MGKVVFISGISSGFGFETARLLSEKGYSVYGTTRNGLGDLSGVNYIRMDLTDPGSIKSAVDQVLKKEGKIDLLINNGGMHSGGPAELLPSESGSLQVETSFTGLVNVIREVLPSMRKQRNGKIINISSIGGLMGLPFQSFYSAAKFAVEGFSEALRMEVKSYGIKVILVNPGDFRTNNSLNRRKFIVEGSMCGDYQDQFQKTLKVIEEDEAGGGAPVVLAGMILKIAETRNPRNRYIVASTGQKLAVFLKRILPGKLFDSILMSHYNIN